MQGIALDIPELRDGRRERATSPGRVAQRAAQVAKTPIDRLRSMMLEARISSALGDHRSAVSLMETIDQAVPDNATVTGLLEKFRQLAAAADASPTG